MTWGDDGSRQLLTAVGEAQSVSMRLVRVRYVGLLPQRRVGVGAVQRLRYDVRWQRLHSLDA